MTNSTDKCRVNIAVFNEGLQTATLSLDSAADSVVYIRITLQLQLSRFHNLEALPHITLFL